MKKILYIFIIIFLSCESFSDLKEHSGISYYDAVAFGWQALFDKDYDEPLWIFSDDSIVYSIALDDIADYIAIGTMNGLYLLNNDGDELWF